MKINSWDETGSIKQTENTRRIRWEKKEKPTGNRQQTKNNYVNLMRAYVRKVQASEFVEKSDSILSYYWQEIVMAVSVVVFILVFIVNSMG